MYKTDDWDYVSNCNNRTFPDGLDAEIFTINALNEAARVSTHPFLREHVTPYIRGIRPDLGSGSFKCGDLIFKTDLSHIRWTLDTAEDLKSIRWLISRLPEGYSWLDALDLETKMQKNTPPSQPSIAPD